MSKFVPDATIDAYLDTIATATLLSVVSDVSTPADLTNTLASVSLTAGDGNGDFTIADGDVSGRKLTVGAQSGVSISASGNANHIVLSLDGTILHITTCTQQALTSGGTVDVPAYDIELLDPS